MKSNNEKIALISEFKEESFRLLDIRFLPPKVLVPSDLDNYKFISRDVEEVNIKNLKIQFLTPSMVALQINIANESIRNIKKLKDRIKIIPSEQKKEDRELGEKMIGHTLEVYEFIEQAQKSIIFSFTALETFVNLSIPKDFIWEKTTTRKKEIYNKEQIERYIPWKEKINLVITDIYKLPEIKQTKFWSSLMELLEIRNRLIHIKSSDDTEVLSDILNKDIIRICFSSQEYINYISENVTENEHIKTVDIEKFPIISDSRKVRLIQKAGDIQPVYIPEEFR
ncbi:hypothetical protein [Psychrobacter immobilis]|uniref:hypothetical protein n=1 Tax=Psychrobacter immobilis TaxID=498 RepID=UPI0019184C72|nr:hypothetical protein [Psychrobacter immobilis]